MALFGYAFQDPINKYQPEKIEKNIFHPTYLPYVVNQENTKSIEKYKEKLQPATDNSKIPNEFKQFSNNSIAANFQPQASLFNSYYNGVSNKEDFVYKKEVYIPKVLPNHYYNSNKFSPAFLALNK